MKISARHLKRLYGNKLFYLLALSLFFQEVGQVRAADKHVDIFFLPHRPAQAVVSEIEKVMAEFTNVVMKKYSFEDPSTAKKLKKYNLTGHMPVAIFINGQNSFTVHGKKISLRNFPKGNSFVPTFAGEWDYDDLRFILHEAGGGK